MLHSMIALAARLSSFGKVTSVLHVSVPLLRDESLYVIVTLTHALLMIYSVF